MTDDTTTMRRAVYDLQLWLKRRPLDPTMQVAVLAEVLAECAVAHGFTLVRLAEMLVLAVADLHDVWSKALDREALTENGPSA